MSLPKAQAGAVALFEAIRPTAPGVVVRSVFGQPAAFVNGNMFLGVFGDAVFVRLSEPDRARAADEAGARPFEPMPGRPMREYVVLAGSILSDARPGGGWVRRSLEYARGLPPKRSAGDKSAKAGARRSPKNVATSAPR